MADKKDSEKTIYPCHVCGLDQEEDVYYTYVFCDCCGCEFGLQDIDPNHARLWRMHWLTTGAKWFDEKYKPKKWNLIEDLTNQLKQVPYEWH